MASMDPYISCICFSIQPRQSHRFRYRTENPDHGSLLGDTERMRACPTVLIQNCPPYANVIIHVSLCAYDSLQVHMHNLHGRNVFNGQYLVTLQADMNGSLECPLEGISISHSKENSKQDLLACKLAQRGILSRNGIEDYKREMEGCVPPNSEFNVSWFKGRIHNFNSLLGEAGCIGVAKDAVRLHCQAFVFNSDGQYENLQAISQTIYDSSSAATSKLNIRVISHTSGSTKGGDQVILLCDKVQKENIEILFYVHDGQYIGMGKFTHADVWHQRAITFKTPPSESTVPVQAKLCLRRKNDPHYISNFWDFEFIPPTTYESYTPQGLLTDPRLNLQPQLPFGQPPYYQPPPNPYP